MFGQNFTKLLKQVADSSINLEIVKSKMPKNRQKIKFFYFIFLLFPKPNKINSLFSSVGKCFGLLNFRMFKGFVL